MPSYNRALFFNAGKFTKYLSNKSKFLLIFASEIYFFPFFLNLLYIIIFFFHVSFFVLAKIILYYLENPILGIIIIIIINISLFDFA